MTESLPDPLIPSNPDNDFIRRIRLIEGDITQLNGIDAIATAVDISLNMGRSLNKALIAAAGPALDDFILEHIYRPHVGDVHVVPGFDLPVPHILVAITPIWRPGREGEDRDLLRCYRSILEMAGRMNLETLAIPAIGAGKGQFPAPRTARLALQAIRERMPDGLEELRIVCDQPATYTAFVERLRIIAEAQE